MPNNVVTAAGNNSNMLQVIFFAVFFAVAALLIPPEKAKSVIALFEGLNDIILKMVDFIIRLFSQHMVRDFTRTMYPVQLFAFTTSSSAAILPVTMKAVENDLHVSKETASFVLPVGVTVNMDGTACYQAIAILFIAKSWALT
ncbi:Glutamate-aspartate carrier protein [Bacteroidales bacterium Barb4]|nr:Glutamate-aspartate carrier protein [Bacteroidales bacterium Barb4]